MSFAVKPAEVRALGEGFLQLKGTASWAYFNAEVDMKVRDSAGEVFALIAAELDSVRDDLMTAYEAGGDVRRLFGSAGRTLKAIAKDYQRTDRTQWATYDGMLDEVDDTAIPWTSDEKGVDRAAYREEFAPTLGPMVCTADGNERLRTGKAEDAFDGYNDFVDIAEGIDYVIGFDWVTDLLGGLGIPSPLGDFQKQVEGDWAGVGRAIGALQLIQQQERAYCQDLDGMIKHLDGVWEGNAANAVKAWIDSTEDKISSHASDLGSIGARIKAEALTIKSGVDTVCTAVEMLVELIPNPKDLAEFFTKGLINSVKKGLDFIVDKIFKVLELFKLGFDAIMTAAFAIVSICAQINRYRDSAWPATPALDGPDVNGPGR